MIILSSVFLFFLDLPTILDIICHVFSILLIVSEAIIIS